jgi:hypothetical protein
MLQIRRGRTVCVSRLRTTAETAGIGRNGDERAQAAEFAAPLVNEKAL